MSKWNVLNNFCLILFAVWEVSVNDIECHSEQSVEKCDMVGIRRLFSFWFICAHIFNSALSRTHQLWHETIEFQSSDAFFFQTILIPLFIHCSFRLNLEFLDWVWPPVDVKKSQNWITCRRYLSVQRFIAVKLFFVHCMQSPDCHHGDSFYWWWDALQNWIHKWFSHCAHQSIHRENYNRSSYQFSSI